jgi:hypothetical protein
MCIWQYTLLTINITLHNGFLAVVIFVIHWARCQWIKQDTNGDQLIIDIDITEGRVYGTWNDGELYIMYWFIGTFVVIF